MALVKTTALAGKARGRSADKAAAGPASVAPPRVARPLRQPLTTGRSIADHLQVATGELASGVTEAAGAAEELRRSMEQIASAAEEAAGGAHESLSAITTLTTSFGQARGRADQSRVRTAALQTLLAEAGSQVDATVAAVETYATRQLGAVEVIGALEQEAGSIGVISQTVADIADNTGLLALNAAIEAARAGEHGRGFAVVADEVRALADTSERRSREVQSLSAQIADEVRAIADRVRAASGNARAEADASRNVSIELDAVRARLAKLAEGSHAILMAAVEADGAAREAQRGAESVSSAAEEQAAAAAQAQRALQQQSASLVQSSRTAESLAALAERLKRNDADATVPEQLGAAAEQLSATVQELSGAATEILAAATQISQGAQIQAAATQQSNAAMTEIERAALSTGGASRDALAELDQIKTQLAGSRAAVAGLTRGVQSSLAEIRAVLALVEGLENSGRRMERIVDSIALIAVQTTMLAVSGSVEAARAGAQGEGFAVVSGDIRVLARDASNNAERVKDLVRSVQSQVEAVRRELELLSAIAEAEIKTGLELGERLAAVDRDAEALRVAGEEVAHASEAATVAVSQVLAGLQQIAAMAEEASNSAAQCATAARQQAQGAEDLAAAIEEIASFADELRKAAA